MECYDAAGTGVPADIVKHLCRADIAVVVPGEDVPHDYAPRVGKHPAVLYGAHPSVRGTEQFTCLQYVLCPPCVGYVLPAEGLESTQMVVAVVPYPMAPPSDLVQKMRMADGVLAYHEKGGLYAEFIQDVKYERRCLWNRTIVKG